MLGSVCLCAFGTCQNALKCTFALREYERIESVAAGCILAARVEYHACTKYVSCVAVKKPVADASLHETFVKGRKNENS